MTSRKPAPRAERPSMPGGYLSPMVLAWPWAESRLIRSRNYWVVTVSAKSRPRARPVWGVWLDGAFYFSTGSLIRRDLEQNPAISVNLESGDECVILEGTASALMEPDTAREVAEAYNAKYSWDMKAEPGEFFCVRPRVAFGWLCDGSGLDRGALFSQTATRWTFEDA
jgi:hypothetical protein